ncbi:MAG TPA: hypothetical protein DDY91_09010 [Planctomycetaceae bacterium]|jgi:hypothetical protein|nr:hypothetical protein [Planctomycetaceae bacterium]
MKRMLLSLAVACIAVVSVHAADEKPKYTTKQVMKFFKEEKLNEKFLKGEISKEETQKLVDGFTAMGQQKPPKGDETAWKEKVDALLKATKDGNKEAFGKAVNCGACHGAHKG